MEAGSERCNIARFEDEKRGQEPRNKDYLYKPENEKKEIFPETIHKRAQL